ncbi:MAG: putative porin [Balneolales bacterium]
MMRYLILLLFLAVFIPTAWAQDEGRTEPAEEEVEAEDDENGEGGPETDEQDGLFEEEEEVIPEEPVSPFGLPEIPSYTVSKTDSLLRWEIWSNPAEWRHYETGNITYRLGGLGRNDATLLRGHEERHQKIYHEGILFNDRVSGSMNSNRMPHHRFSRVYERGSSIRHETHYQNRRFYITEPLTMISYDQGQNNLRSTEGFFTRNVGRKTNIELTYWGKNDDGLYPNKNFSGRIASGRAFHHISDRLIAEAGILYNGLQLDEPDGYVIPDMNAFSFLQYNVSPVESQARSSTRNSMMFSSLWYRPDGEAEVNTQISAFRNQYRRFYYGSADSTFYQVASSGLQASRWVETGPLSLQLSLTAEQSGVDKDTNRSLARTSWMSYGGRSEGELRIVDETKLSAWANTARRNDGFQDYELGARVDAGSLFGLSGHASFALGEQMPSIQQLYWDSAFQGNPDLGNESLVRMEAGFYIAPWPVLQVGARAYRKEVSHPLAMGMDSIMTQTRGYNSDGAEVFARLDASRLESDVSLTYQDFSSLSTAELDRHLAGSGSRVWARASAFYKNYIFDRAAFVKVGGGFLFSPSPYRSATYYPQMDYWDSNSFAGAIPAFHRFDLELSARVRTVIVSMRMENVLNQVTQPGYFETANNPMPGRNFRFGIKWILRN